MLPEKAFILGPFRSSLSNFQILSQGTEDKGIPSAHEVRNKVRKYHIFDLCCPKQFYHPWIFEWNKASRVHEQ